MPALRRREPRGLGDAGEAKPRRGVGPLAGFWCSGNTETFRARSPTLEYRKNAPHYGDSYALSRMEIT
jgi:hypothetical protein